MSNPISIPTQGAPVEPAKDPRIVYGVRCSWWDSISKAGTREVGGHRLPVCPHCGSPLFESPDDKAWWRQVDAHEAKGHPGYRAMLEWIRGKCFPSFEVASRRYEATIKEGA